MHGAVKQSSACWCNIISKLIAAFNDKPRVRESDKGKIYVIPHIVDEGFTPTWHLGSCVFPDRLTSCRHCTRANGDSALWCKYDVAMQCGLMQARPAGHGCNDFGFKSAAQSGSLIPLLSSLVTGNHLRTRLASRQTPSERHRSYDV